MSDLTPMMQQYRAIKLEAKDALLFYRLGDFYEMFGNDALEASKILGITLTARNKGDNKVPMCGVPYHAVESYLARLTLAGKKVAICEQIGDPSLPGIVKRKIVRIVTPGTTQSPHVLNEKTNRYVLALFPKKDYFGLAFCDLSTGLFQAAEFPGVEALKVELLRLDPAELVLCRDHYDDPDLRALLIELTEAPLSPCDFYEEAHAFLSETFHVKSLEGFGVGSEPFAIQAAALLMRYLKDTQKDLLPHIDRITAYHREDFMPLSEACIRNLELFTTLRGNQQDPTLLKILDETRSSMGGRLLRQWLTRPLLKRGAIEQRRDAVETLLKTDETRLALCEELSLLSDLERLLSRLSTANGNARDLVGLAHSLARIPRIKQLLSPQKALRLGAIQKELLPLESLAQLITKAILEEPALRLTEGGLIKPGFHKELDELRAVMRDAKSALKKIEEDEIKATGISSLKVRFNKVFGYYIEVSKANLPRIPEYFYRKQTLVNAERFITPELKEYEEKVLTAEERAGALEFKIFEEIRGRALEHVAEIKQNAQLLAELDVLLSFAQVAIRRNYCRPEFTEQAVLEIHAGRHPVVESTTFEQSFIPNDASFKQDQTEIKLLTGPNMSGKSTYLRQVALIVLMAQMGSYVPAASLRMRVIDRIFTRVGSSDNLARGESTFMVEMQEAAYILNNATDRSLIILDELGRGTSTYDGLSIAWALLEYLHDHVRGFTLFATHYHELIRLAEKLPRAKNYCVDVKETEKGVLFLHQIHEGGIDKSYGIEVARLAGLPKPLLERARQILKNLEEEKLPAAQKISENQMTLFTRITHPALEKLRNLDINNLTPLEALSTLHELQRLKAKEGL